ncbi:ketopantoate reductase family protein [Liquorilactobacillus satsumensis]|uniref:2-dehydropantoate 2-reductase n=1 Tax=Liquorilactobacillus satsumensis DSM 16230 = JCM 12392 TaxID=1423801 RepID=A0A0R1UX15_9LACO|nr:ketopantoate reductase family protein [Liquorilactobacillus satsumensis]KRL97807.1 2-dehydropantoate 2-reductase [Liquorilactobacillus satsumensis DSM 16230 = JCM 12392]MCC7666130.1 ketopantoate reductase family protein [Liquorilactobacillus satsumensis]MCP9313556.1 ketopantoate reductase family protein [Liquorilactobacillus satsumensis]MCP9357397.1 ketopantoate reductase family protein [Liquorilactobacillus satsumensis]MCP9360678.1 ketopantoate reductase family protein [Liquorilactobacillu
MKFTVLGAGAMGYRYGVLLQEAGNQVDFVDTWEKNVEKVREQGGVLVARDHQDQHLVPVNVYYPEEYQGHPDVWVVFTKQMQLADFLKRTAHCFDEKQYVLTCMNGMGHVEKLLEYFKPAKLIAGTALVATVLNGPGDVDFIGARGAGTMNLANYTEKPDEMTHKVVTELEKAQFNPNLTTNFMGTLLAKVVFNSVVNTLCTLFEITMGEFASYPGADELSKQLINEAYDVCERAGIQMLNTRQAELESVNYVSTVANPLHYPSMYQDMSHNRPTEVDYINGYLVELGRKYRYEATTHAFLTHLVHLAEHTRQAPKEAVSE